MMRYAVRLAFVSLRRTPVLSAVMIVSLALGISTWVTARAAIEGATRNPLPAKTGLYHVALERPPRFSDVLDPTVYGRFEHGPESALSVREYRRLASSSIPTRSAGTFAGPAAVAAASASPVIDDVRFAGRDLFAIFALPFVRGGPWSAADEANGTAVVVIDEQTSRDFWGDAEPLGQQVRIAGVPFSVVGVIAGAAREKLFDLIYFRRETERFYVPLESFVRLEIAPAYAFSSTPHGPSFADLIASDDMFIHLWIELRSAAEWAAYAAAIGPSARVVPFDAFRRELYWLHPAYSILQLFAQIALVASALNLVRLLLAKFTARADQTGIHRALGASRRWIVVQHVIEAQLVGVAGGLLGLGLGLLGMAMLNGLVPDRIADAVLDGTDVVVTMALALGIGLIAGAYPAWRATAIAPAVFLRRR